MTIVHGTRVIWEEPSPQGSCYNNILCEGRVIDAETIRAMDPLPGYVYVTENPNAILTLKDCRLVSIKRLVY